MTGPDHAPETAELWHGVDAQCNASLDELAKALAGMAQITHNGLLSEGSEMVPVTRQNLAAIFTVFGSHIENLTGNLPTIVATLR